MAQLGSAGRGLPLLPPCGAVPKFLPPSCRLAAEPGCVVVLPRVRTESTPLSGLLRGAPPNRRAQHCWIIKNFSPTLEGFFFVVLLCSSLDRDPPVWQLPRFNLFSAKHFAFSLCFSPLTRGRYPWDQPRCSLEFIPGELQREFWCFLKHHGCKHGWANGTGGVWRSTGEAEIPWVGLGHLYGVKHFLPFIPSLIFMWRLGS